MSTLESLLEGRRAAARAVAEQEEAQLAFLRARPAPWPRCRAAGEPGADGAALFRRTRRAGLCAQEGGEHGWGKVISETVISETVRWPAVSLFHCFTVSLITDY